MRAEGLSQTELAKRSDVSQKHISNAVNLRTSSSIEAIDLLGQALGVPGWALMIAGIDECSKDEVHSLGSIMAAWIGADDEGRALIAAVAKSVGLRG
jgi:transcriptional regulator with XRE-family HTH domain